MILLKALFKLVFKWLFQLLSAVEKQAGAPNDNAPPEKAEVAAETVMHSIRKTVSNLEERLQSKAETMANGAEASQNANHSDVNDLRAELAELKADLRVLKRLLINRSDSHVDSSNQ